MITIELEALGSTVHFYRDAGTSGMYHNHDLCHALHSGGEADMGFTLMSGL